MNRRTWTETDVTGGPIDRVFAWIRSNAPEAGIDRLVTARPSDDDNVWFIRLSESVGEIQLDSMPDGAPPFLLESDFERERADTAEAAIGVLNTWLES